MHACICLSVFWYKCDVHYFRVFFDKNVCDGCACNSNGVSDTITVYDIFRCNTFYLLSNRFHSNVGYLHVRHTPFVFVHLHCTFFVVRCKFPVTIYPLCITNQIRILFHRQRQEHSVYQSTTNRMVVSSSSRKSTTVSKSCLIFSS